MVMAGALLHLVFFSAVVGFFGHPAATDVAFAVDCAFEPDPELPVPDETVTLVNLAPCCVAAVSNSRLSDAVSGIGVPVVVLVVELEGGAVDRTVSSNALPRCQAMM
jgi:hypothetical protein